MRRQTNISAGFIVFHRGPEGCRFLLVLSRLTKRPLWEYPKGGVDSGETLLQAALRELREETGLAGDDVRHIPGFERRERYRFLAAEGDPRALIHKEVTYFLAEAAHREVQIATAEIREFAWLPLEDAMRRIRYVGRRKFLREAAALVGCIEAEAPTST